jgi:hypothetical protein
VRSRAGVLRWPGFQKMTTFEKATQIIMPDTRWREIVLHCSRKLDRDYAEGESREPKAFGLIAGTAGPTGGTLAVSRVYPAKNNLRGVEPYKSYMDDLMERYAMPFGVPFHRRGWVMDPLEVKHLRDECARKDLTLFGFYHMHTIPWEGDPLRDVPTRLDGVLAQHTGLIAFVVSMIDRNHPTIRAFYEGRAEREIPILKRPGPVSTR